MEWTRRESDDGSAHWSRGRLAAKLKLTHMMMARVWHRHGLQPHRLRHHIASDDPAFESRASDIIGLYLKLPAHTAVFCVDEKTALQALDLSPGRVESHGFEHFRHGTLSICAALEGPIGSPANMGRAARRRKATACPTWNQRDRLSGSGGC